MLPSSCDETAWTLITMDSCSPSVTAPYFTGKEALSKTCQATASDPNQCDIQVTQLSAILFANKGQYKDMRNVMYDTPAVFYYLMRNALEINIVSGTIVLLKKSPWNSCWHFRKRLYVNQENVSPKAHSIEKSNFPSFCLVMRHLDCKVMRIFQIKIYEILRNVLYDQNLTPICVHLFVKADVQSRRGS